MAVRDVSSERALSPLGRHMTEPSEEAYAAFFMVLDKIRRNHDLGIWLPMYALEAAAKAMYAVDFPRGPREDDRPAVRELAENLVAALDRCTPALTAQAVMAYARGQRYSGPTFGVELEALRAALRGPASGAGPERGNREALYRKALEEIAEWSAWPIDSQVACIEMNARAQRALRRAASVPGAREGREPTDG